MLAAYLRHSFFIFLDSKSHNKNKNKVSRPRIRSVSFRFNQNFQYYVLEYSLFSYFCFLNFKQKLNFTLKKNYKLNTSELFWKGFSWKSKKKSSLFYFTSFFLYFSRIASEFDFVTQTKQSSGGKFISLKKLNIFANSGLINFPLSLDFYKKKNDTKDDDYELLSIHLNITYSLKYQNINFLNTLTYLYFPIIIQI